MKLSQSKNTEIGQARRAVIQQNRVKYMIKETQQLMLSLADNLSSYEPFDNSVTPADCVDRLVAHRVSSKFHIDDPKGAKVLQDETFKNYLDYDATLKTNIDVFSNPHLNLARIRLNKWFENFSINAATLRYRVSPGETFISSGGEVSITSKLLHKNHWTVTANCLDPACVFVYNNLSFRRAAKQHIGVVTRKERRKLYNRFRHHTDVGFRVFRYLLISRVFILVDGARASSVPKSNDKRRFINIEAMFSVIIQRAIAQAFLRVLRKVGNHLGENTVQVNKDAAGVLMLALRGDSVFPKELELIPAQYFHGCLLKSGDFSTIDFSNASDSVTIAAVSAMFPKHVSDLLLKTRSHYVEIDGVLYSPNKLSSMGNGFTFEVMTILLYAIAHTFSPDSRVYGDDVIIRNEHAQRFVDTCKLIDFRVNEKKTFINSFFRESCGHFYSDHIGDYITSFDFNQVTNLADIVITCNKLTTIIEAGQVSDLLCEQLISTRDSIASLVHASRKGPLPATLYERRKYLSSFIFDRKYVTKQRRSKELRTLRQHFIKKNEFHFEACQLNVDTFALVYISFFVPDRSQHLFTNCKGLDVLLPALYSGKRLIASQKGKGRWVDLPAFVDHDGTITLLSSLVKPCDTIWRDRLEGIANAHIK